MNEELDIDMADYAILTAISEADKPLWKKAVHERLHEREESLPGSNVSVQTIGRRIDTLTKNDYLENVIVSPDNLARDLIIAFKLTDEGKAAIAEKRRELIKNVVRTNIFPEDRQTDVPQKPIIEMIGDEFNLNEEAKTVLAERYDAAELAAVLTMYYAEQEAEEFFSGKERQLFRQTASGEKSFDEILNELK